MDEHDWIKSAVVNAALVPRGRLRINILESADPFLFHAQCHCERQKLLEGFRRLADPVHVIGFDVRQEILEAQHARECLRTAGRARRHEPSKSGDDSARKNRRDEKRRRRYSHFCRERIAHVKQQHAGGNSSPDIPVAHVIGTVLEIAALHQLVENIVLDSGEFSVKHILQAGKLDVGLPAIQEDPREKRQFVRLQAGPFLGALLQMEDVILVVDEAHHSRLFRFFDDDVPAHGEIHDRGRNVAHCRLLIHQRPSLGRTHSFRRRVLHGDRTDTRVAPARVPEPEHQ